MDNARPGDRATPWRPNATRVLLGLGSFAIVLVPAFVWLRERPVPPTETVLLVDGTLGIHELLEQRSSGQRPIDDPGIVRSPVPLEVVRVLVPSVRSNRCVYDPLTYFGNPPRLRGQYAFSEHPEGRIRIVTNAMGLREDEELLAERPDLRVLVTGDSHTEGVVPNRESFTNVLEVLLGDASQPRSVEALNAACGGYTFYSYLGVLEKYLDLDPDVFVVTVYGGNDFDGAVPWYRWFRRLPPGRSDKLFTQMQKAARRASVPAFAQAVRQVAFFRTFPEELDLALAAAREVALEADRLCREHAIRLVFVYLPSVLEAQPWVAGAALARTAEAFDLSQEDLAGSGEPGRRWVEFLRANDIECVDLLPILSEAEEPAYWRTDHHLNTHGHRLVAEALAQRLGADGRR